MISLNKNRFTFNKISIIIQGPYKKETTKLIKDLKNIFPENQLILSCYNEVVDESVKDIITIIRNKDAGGIIVPPRRAPINLKRQATTTYSACKKASEDWVMKIRTDIEITNPNKFKKAINKFCRNISNRREIKLLTLNTGSLDIFSYYQMPFHFNDHFFICRRLTLLENCDYLRNFDEQILIDSFNPNNIKNYYHRKKYSLLFHTEQLIHFCKKLLIEKKMKYCCEMKKETILRNIIWNGKNLMLYSMRSIGIKSTKHGYPKLRSHLAGISYKSIYLYRAVYFSPKRIRFIFLFLLKIHGNIRKLIFIVLTYLLQSQNIIKGLLSIFKNYIRQNNT